MVRNEGVTILFWFGCTGIGVGLVVGGEVYRGTGKDSGLLGGLVT